MPPGVAWYFDIAHRYAKLAIALALRMIAGGAFAILAGVMLLQ